MEAATATRISPLSQNSKSAINQDAIQSRWMAFFFSEARVEQRSTVWRLRLFEPLDSRGRLSLYEQLSYSELIRIP